MTHPNAAAGIGLPKSDLRPIASDARQLFHLLDSAVEKLRTAPAVPEICRLQKDLGPLLGTSRDLAQNAVVSLEMDRDYEAVMRAVRPASGLPEPSSEISTDVIFRASDLRRLAEILYAQIVEFTAPAESEQYGVLCRSAALARVVEAQAEQLEARAEVLDRALRAARS